MFVDDGSSPPILASAPARSMRAFRVLDDIPWNQPGARNLGALNASGEWILFHDIDHFISSQNTSDILSQLDSLNPMRMYRFSRAYLNSDAAIASHMNTFLIQKELFVSLGGYDSDFSGNYAFDDTFFDDVFRLANGKVSMLTSIVVRVDETLITKNLSRDLSVNSLLRKKKLRELRRRKLCKLLNPFTLLKLLFGSLIYLRPRLVLGDLEFQWTITK